MKDIRIFETHAHYDDKAFDSDRDELLSESKANHLEYIINVSSDLRSTEDTYELTEKYENVYGAIGIHPSEVEELNENNYQRIRELALKKKILAIGEIGLDYHYDEPAKELQKDWFERQLVMAREIGKPVIIHSRDACEDTVNILKSPSFREIPGVMHCYSYSVETARELLKIGYYFGIGGVITFSNARKLIEAVEEIPLDRIVLETDCPYLAPTPHRGERNDSRYLPLIAEKIAAVKNVPYYKVIEQTYKNARLLFMNKK